MGRIVVSTTDDIESKVIRHYGGTRWRRLVNFMRGVNEGAGRRGGESCVCLRESNVPVHTHEVTLLTSKVYQENLEHWSELQQYDRMKIGSQGSEFQRLNLEAGEESPHLKGTFGVKDKELEYQVGQMKHVTHEGGNDHITYPHNNIPPHREVYIWECTED